MDPGVSFSTPPNSGATISDVSGGGANARNARVLACVLCQQRKIKCDRNPLGCANCAKSRVKCTPSTPAPARKRRRPRQDLQDRLAHCEQLLKQYVSAETRKPSTQSAIQPIKEAQSFSSSSPPIESTPDIPSMTPQRAFVFSESRKTSVSSNVESPNDKTASQGRLIQEEGGVRFTESILLGTISDSLQAMKDILDEDDGTPGTDESTPGDGAATDEHADLLLGSDSPGTVIEDLHPPPGQMFRLWQVFLERVNPLMKVIHVPTVQPYLADAASGILPSKNIEPLLFAIYTVAVVSLTADESKTILGMTRDEALSRYSLGVRRSLVRMDFLKNADLSTLQALLMYLMSLEGRHTSYSVWIMSGVTIRLAQKLGLHRDGEMLGLSPFETEMRRRIWWQVKATDDRCAMHAGMSYSTLPRGWDAKEPRNVNDTDLHPSATQAIEDKDGPTEMIFCLLAVKMTKFKVLHPEFEPGLAMSKMITNSSDGGDDSWKDFYRGLIEELSGEFSATLDRFCDPSMGPVHELAMMLNGRMVRKMGELIQLNDQMGANAQLREPRDRAFMIAVATLERAVEWYGMTSCDQFAWLSRTLFQIDVFAYVCGQLCFRHTGPHIDHAWTVVEKIYKHRTELKEMSQKTHSDIATFILKAWALREEALWQQTGVIPETPSFIQELRILKPSVGVKSTPLSTNSSSSEPLPPTQFTDLNMTGNDASMAEYLSDQQVLDQYSNVNPFDWSIWATMNPNTSGFGAGTGFPGDMSTDSTAFGDIDIIPVMGNLGIDSLKEQSNGF